MSIAQANRIKELEQALTYALQKTNSLQNQIDDVKCRLEALETRPRPGRPPKDDNGRQPTN